LESGGRASQTHHTRVADLTCRGRDIANQLASLYKSSGSESDRAPILEAAA
jgi:hypothetical protein